MLQFFISLSMLVIVCTAVLVVYTISMYVCISDIANIIYHAPITSKPMSHLHHVQRIVYVSDTRKLIAYNKYMHDRLNEIGIVRTVDNAWTTSIVGSCVVYTHNTKKGA